MSSDNPDVVASLPVRVRRKGSDAVRKSSVDDRVESPDASRHSTPRATQTSETFSKSSTGEPPGTDDLQLFVRALGSMTVTGANTKPMHNRASIALGAPPASPAQPIRGLSITSLARPNAVDTASAIEVEAEAASSVTDGILSAGSPTPTDSDSDDEDDLPSSSAAEDVSIEAKLPTAGESAEAVGILDSPTASTSEPFHLKLPSSASNEGAYTTGTGSHTSNDGSFVTGSPRDFNGSRKAAEMLLSKGEFVADGNTRRTPSLKANKLYCMGMDGALKKIRAKVSKKKNRFTEDDFDLDLTYITPRIIAMGFPSSGREGLYRNPIAEVQRFFETRHSGRYKIYNLCSERSYDPSDFLGRVCRFPFDDHNPCPLELISEFCADVDQWLNADPHNVIAVHCKAGKGRTGLMIAAYLLHSNLRSTAESALRWFGLKRTANGQGVTIPSQMRWVHYYEQMLKTGPPLVFTYQIQYIRVRGVPHAEMGGGCMPYLDISCNGSKVFDYKIAVGKKLRRYKKGEPYMDFDLTKHDICVIGNVKLQLYHESLTATSKLCHLWFHTGFVARNYLVFSRNVIDKANKDKRGVFGRTFAIEVYLQRVPTDPDDEDVERIAAELGATAASQESEVIHAARKRRQTSSESPTSDIAARRAERKSAYALSSLASAALSPLSQLRGRLKHRGDASPAATDSDSEMSRASGATPLVSRVPTPVDTP